VERFEVGVYVSSAGGGLGGGDSVNQPLRELRSIPKTSAPSCRRLPGSCGCGLISMMLASPIVIGCKYYLDWLVFEATEIGVFIAR